MAEGGARGFGMRAFEKTRKIIPAGAATEEREGPFQPPARGERAGGGAGPGAEDGAEGVGGRRGNKGRSSGDRSQEARGEAPPPQQIVPEAHPCNFDGHQHGAVPGTSVNPQYSAAANQELLLPGAVQRPLEADDHPVPQSGQFAAGWFRVPTDQQAVPADVLGNADPPALRFRRGEPETREKHFHPPVLTPVPHGSILQPGCGRSDRRIRAEFRVKSATNVSSSRVARGRCASATRPGSSGACLRHGFTMRYRKASRMRIAQTAPGCASFRLEAPDPATPANSMRSTRTATRGGSPAGVETLTTLPQQ